MVMTVILPSTDALTDDGGGYPINFLFPTQYFVDAFVFLMALK